MKKVGVILILMLLLTSFVLAQANQDTDPTQEVSTEEVEEAEETASESVEGFKKSVEGLDNAIEKEIVFPERIQPLVKIVLGIQESETTRQFFVIMVALWLIFYLFFSEIMAISALFSSTTKNVTALLLVIMLAALGFLETMAITLIKAGQSFSVLEDWSSGVLFLLLIGLIITGLILKKIGQYFKTRNKIIQAHAQGIEIGASIGVMDRIRNMFARISGKTYGMERAPKTPKSKATPYNKLPNKESLTSKEPKKGPYNLDPSG